MEAELERIQREVYNELVDRESFRTIDQLLAQYRELLTVAQMKYPEQFPNWRSKYRGLQSKVRSAQIKRDEELNEITQQQRLAKYHVEEAIPTEMSTEEAREALFAGRSSAIKEKAQESVDHQIVSTNKKITSSLQQTRQLMTTSILQTELNIDSLDQQTKDLKTLNESYMKFSDILTASDQVVKFIQKQDRADQRRIRYALVFLGFCVLRVFWSRALSLPIRMILWWFIRLFKVFGYVFGLGKSAAVSSAAVESFATETFASVVESVSSEVSPVVESVISSVDSSTFIESAVESSSTIVESVVEASSFIESVVEASSSIVELFPDTVSQVPLGEAQVVESVELQAESVVESVVEAISSASQTIIEHIVGMVSSSPEVVSESVVENFVESPEIIEQVVEVVSESSILEHVIEAVASYQVVESAQEAIDYLMDEL